MKAPRRGRKSFSSAGTAKLILNHNPQFIGRQILKWDLAPVYENGGRALHAERVPTLSILHNTVCDQIALDVTFIAFDVNSDLFCISFEDRSHIKLFFPVVLVIVDHMVHLPELPMQPRGFSRRRCRQRVLVSWHQRKLSERDL